MTRSPFTLAVTSLKPHGGRTTSALALAWVLGRSGHRVLLVDGNVYPSLLPKKTTTGEAELWPNVLLGSRRPGEASDVGADVVIIDAPPLTGKKVDRILQAADTILLSIFPIVQNARFLPKAKEKLVAIDSDKILGWIVSNVGEGNRHHADLIVDLETELGEYAHVGTIPALRDVSTWKPMTGADLPEGRLRDAFVDVARYLEGRLATPDECEEGAPAPEHSFAAPDAPAEPATRAPASTDAKGTPEPATAVPATDSDEPQALLRNLLPKAPPPQASAAPRFDGNHPVLDETPAPPPGDAPGHEDAPQPDSPEPLLLDESPTSSASIDRLLEDIDRMGGPPATPNEPASEPELEPEPEHHDEATATEHVSVEVTEPGFDGPKAPDPPPTFETTVKEAAPSSGSRTTRWRLVSDRPVRLSLTLVPVEGHFEIGQHHDVLPHQTPSPAIRALLRFGLIHTVHRGRDDEDTAESATQTDAETPPSMRLRPLQETQLPVRPARNVREDSLLVACRALVQGDSGAALETLESGRKTDARFLSALLRLAAGEPHLARRHLVAAIRGANRLGVDLAQHGLAVHAAVELDHGVAVHFGANLRGAHVCRVVASLMRGDPEETLTELNELVGLDPDDVLLRALLVERLLRAETSSEFDALHRASFPHDYQTRVHTALAYFRAVALHRMGLPEAAYLGLTEAIEAEGHRTDTLRHAMLYERVMVAETLGRIQHVRRDLEVLFGEAPDYADVGVRLGLAA